MTTQLPESCSDFVRIKTNNLLFVPSCPILDEGVTDADWTRPRSRRGCGRLSDWTRSRTGHGHGRLTGFWRGHFAAKPRLLRGRKNLILMRSKACPGLKLKNFSCDAGSKSRQVHDG